MVIDNKEQRNNLVREHCRLIEQMQLMYDAIGLSKGVEGAKVSHDRMQAMRERIAKHADDHGITQAEIFEFRNRGRVRAVSVSDAIKKLA